MNNYIDLILITAIASTILLILYGIYNIPSQIRRFKAFLTNGGYNYTILATRVDDLANKSLRQVGYSKRDAVKKFRQVNGSRYKIVGVDKN